MNSAPRPTTAPRPRVGRRRRWLCTGAAVGALLVASACEAVMVEHVNTSRRDAGQPELRVAMYLTEAARSNSVEMCQSRVAAPSADPLSDYDGESARAIHERVGRATLDPAIEDGSERNVAATNAIWAQWQSDPALTAAQWDEMGVGEATCGDGRLYMTLLLRDNPAMPSSGRYATRVHTAAQVASTTGIVYGRATDHQGSTVDLLLDVYSPPFSAAVGARPLVVLVHGGGFVNGSRSDLAGAAVEYARRGFVAASIDYRLRPHENEQQQLIAATQAIDDGMESVRWLKANAATYHIDTSRIAVLGSSASGAIALGIGEASDPTPGGPLAAHSPAVTAVLSTGASLTPGLSAVGLEATDAPAMMFYFEQDTSQYKHTWDWAYETCTAIRDADNSCDFIKQAGSGHTIPLSAQGPWWTPEIGPFLWHHLGL